MNQTRHIAAVLDVRSANDSERTVGVTVSSEFPVPRGHDIVEVLDHSPGAIDLSRSPLPLIESHDTTRLNVGLVEDLHAEGDRLRGTLRLGSSARADELWRDIKSGIVRNVSVAYVVIDSVMDAGRMLVTSWMPHEVSLVAVGADPQAGIGRSKHMSEDNTPNVTAQLASVQPPATTPRRDFEAMEKIRRDNLKALCEMFRSIPGVERMRDEWLDDMRTPVDEARRTLLAALELHNGRPDPSRQTGASGFPTDIVDGSSIYTRTLGIAPNETRTYSVQALIRRMGDPKFSGGGYELECSQQIEQQGQKARHGGCFIPIDLPMRGFGFEGGQRTLTAGGSTLVGTQHMPERFIDVIRARSVTLQAGATQLTGLVQNVSIPRKTAPAAVAWLSLDGTDQITPTDSTYDAVALSPNQLAGITAFSHLLIRQGLPATEALVRNDLAQTVAEGIDAALLNGSGVGSEPAGISQTAATKNTHTAAAPTYSQIVALRQGVFTAGADVFAGLAYVAHPGLLTQLEGTQKFVSEGNAIADAALSDGQFSINGVPGYYSANQAANAITFGAWSECLVGWWGPGVELVTDASYDFARASQAVRVIADIDTDVRHAGSFAISTPV